MEEEIDLRPYIITVLQNWKWLIGAAVLAALLVLGFTFLQSPTYEATTLVAITEPRQILQFDPRIQSVEENQPLKVFPEIAQSDELLQELLREVAFIDSEVNTLVVLRNRLSAEAGADPSLLRLTVKNNLPEPAAEIANLWAEKFVGKANEIYGNQGGDQLRFFEEQAAAAKQELEIVEQGLIEFEGQNNAGIVSNELNSLKQTQAEYLKRKKEIVFLLQDVPALRDQVASENDQTGISSANQLTALFLQLKAFNAEAGVPLQMQLNSTNAFASQNQQELKVSLDNLIETLSARLFAIDTALAELEPEILNLQEQLQEIDTENNRLTRGFSVAEETYTTLTNKVEEERISSQDKIGGVQLVSQAAVPKEPVGSRRLIKMVIAGILGFILSVFGLFMKQWWQSANLAAFPSNPS